APNGVAVIEQTRGNTATYVTSGTGYRYPFGYRHNSPTYEGPIGASLIVTLELEYPDFLSHWRRNAGPIPAAR
ncbi:MAG: hypothetical protein ABI383_14110, partial [Acidobacteriaceae bacterium]